MLTTGPLGIVDRDADRLADLHAAVRPHSGVGQDALDLDSQEQHQEDRLRATRWTHPSSRRPGRVGFRGCAAGGDNKVTGDIPASWFKIDPSLSTHARPTTSLGLHVRDPPRGHRSNGSSTRPGHASPASTRRGDSPGSKSDVNGTPLPRFAEVIDYLSRRRRGRHDHDRRHDHGRRERPGPAPVDGLRINDTVSTSKRPASSSATPSAVRPPRDSGRPVLAGHLKQGGWEDRPAEIAPRAGADPSNLVG